MDTGFEVSKAHLYFKQKKYLEAAKLFEEIAADYSSKNQELLAVEMLNNASVAHLMSGDAQKAYDLSKDTHLPYEKVNDWTNYSLALGNQASALESLGKKDLALKYFQQAAEKLQEIGDKESRAYIMKRISTLQIQQGDQLGALGSMTAALHNLPKLSKREKFLKKLTDIVLKIGNR